MKVKIKKVKEKFKPIKLEIEFKTSRELANFMLAMEATSICWDVGLPPVSSEHAKIAEELKNVMKNN